MKPICVVFFILLLPAASLGSTWYVPDDFPTIQDAIAAAVEGDIIIVRSAIYHENIDFLGKNITVRSELGPDVTSINGGQLGSVVTFKGGEGPDAVFEGFTVINGTGTEVNDNLYGGGIYCTGSSPTIRRNIIRLNSALPSGHVWEVGRGGGIFCYDSAATIDENTISENMADTGGGISAGESTLSITNNTIAYNSSERNGAGLHCGFDLISGNIISGNNSGESGGGIDCSSSTVTNNVITGNIADDSGGGIYCSSAIVTENVISDNSAGSNGGGISYSSGTIMANTISGNSAGSFGGGISGGDATIKSNTIVGNSASHGGGVSCESSLIDCLIAENTAAETGGGIRINRGVVYVTNCTIHENSADLGGGISVYSESYTIITNSVLWNDEAQAGSEIYFDDAYPFFLPILSITASDVKGGLLSVQVNPGCTLLWGTGMIDADPLFVQPDEGDFHLTYDSPCRDAGLITAPNLPDTDFEGDPRIAGAAPDIGADEFHRHLYFTGDALPGGSVEVRVVGNPLLSPVILGHGAGILDPPVPTPFGDLYLAQPILQLDLGAIPESGVLIHPTTVPGYWIPGEEHPFQALVGQELSNLKELEVLNPGGGS